MMKELSRARQRESDVVSIAMKRERKSPKALSQLQQESTLNSEIGMTQFIVQFRKRICPNSETTFF